MSITDKPNDWGLVILIAGKQVFEDIQAIMEWILIEKLHIPLSERNMYSAILVVPDTFDNRGNFMFLTSKELISL